MFDALRDGLALSLALVAAGSLAYVLLAMACVASWTPPGLLPRLPLPRVTVLKPLYGAEPMLEPALRSFFVQDYPGPMTLVFGVADPADPALHVVERLKAEHPHRACRIVVDCTPHGANHKVANLINMARGIDDEILVISDSDVFATPAAVAAVVSPLRDAKVGAATCLYRGRPAVPESLVAQLGALYLDLWFAPTVFVHARLSSPSVCYGPLTAIRREVLERGGGFAGLADCLADDTELGHLTRRQGLEVVIASAVVETTVAETRLGDLVKHELRWAKTTRALQPPGYAASIFTHPGPLPWLLLLMRHGPAELALVFGLALARLALLALLRRRIGRAPGVWRWTWALAPLREQLYFCVWVAGFVGRTIWWRGHALQIQPDVPTKGAARSPGMTRAPNEA